MYRWLQRVWYEDAASGAVLRPLGWLFHAIVLLRHWLYRIGVLRSYSVGCPLIVIGNITVGGTGKTPLTLWVVSRLQERGFKVGIVMRGYGADESAPRLVDAQSSYRDVGDEAVLLAKRSGVPVAVGVDRVRAARLLVEGGVEVIVADDGLQHLRLRRDLQIAVVDGVRRFGNGRLLPAGPLRDPLSRLNSVDVLVVNGVARTAGELSMALVPGEVLSLDGKASMPLSGFAGRRVHAVAGIGNPGRFFNMLENASIQPIAHPFRDHEALTPAAIEFHDDLPVIMTEKDAVKCTRMAPASNTSKYWFVPVSAMLSAADTQFLLKYLESVTGRSRQSPLR